MDTIKILLRDAYKLPKTMKLIFVKKMKNLQIGEKNLNINKNQTELLFKTSLKLYFIITDEINANKLQKIIQKYKHTNNPIHAHFR